MATLSGPSGIGAPVRYDMPPRAVPPLRADARPDMTAQAGACRQIIMIKRITIHRGGILQRYGNGGVDILTQNTPWA